MEEEEEDEEDNEEFLERLMAQTGREVPQQELEENFSVLGELGSGTYGRVTPCSGCSDAVDGRTMEWVGLEGTSKIISFQPSHHEELLVLCTGSPLAAQTRGYGWQSRAQEGSGCPGSPSGECHPCEGVPWPQEGLPEELVKRCASQLAEALDFMHGRALVHRDVKLDNVLLFDRECRRVKLGDFGLTRLQGSAVGAMSGTLPYAPPELCLLQGSDTLELDSSLDVWAFAVLIFCLCTGCFPWAAAASSDPQFEEFRAWQDGGEVGRGVPVTWRGFGTGALEMLGRLLTLDPDRRSPAMEVHKYLALPWV
ncbi:SBK1 kinase, partial [Brachypteracias leptosomus]|nr:SBK1 kinase [Brachypteracias leptosomus]